MGCVASSELQILVLLGSPRKNSNNKGLLEALIDAEQFIGSGIQAHIPDLSQIPFFNEDYQIEKRIPESVINLKKLCKQSQLILFVTPQYNSSVSALVKNAYDWLSRQDAENDNNAVISGKCAAVMSTSYFSQTQIEDCEKMGAHCKLRFFKKPFYVNLPSGGFDEKGKMKNETQRKKVIQWGAELFTWANLNK